MNRTTTRLPRPAAAVAAVLAALLVLVTAASATTAAWRDDARFVADVSAGTWADPTPTQSCEVLRISTGEVVGPCEVTGIRATNEWASVVENGVVLAGGLDFEVDVDGFTAGQDLQVRATVDLSTMTGTTYQWDWPSGEVMMYTSTSDWSAAPYLTFTTREWNDEPFGGQFVPPGVG